MNFDPSQWPTPLERRTAFRYSEERDRPDIAAWSSQRAADLVRRFIAEANLVLALEAGATVRFVPFGAGREIRRDSSGTLLGWYREHEAVVRFEADCVYPSADDPRPSAWVGILDPGELRPVVPGEPAPKPAPKGATR
jgi:hypothetical protein